MQEKTIDALLAEHPFFGELDPRYLELIAGCGKNVRFDAGRSIACEGEAADIFYAIRRGCVAVEVYAPGRGAVTIQTLGEGDVLGWSWLFPPYRWLFDARAVDLVRAVAFDAKCLRTKCDDDPVMGYQFMKRFAREFVARLEATKLQLVDVYGKL